MEIKKKLKRKVIITLLFFSFSELAFSARDDVQRDSLNFIAGTPASVADQLTNWVPAFLDFNDTFLVPIVDVVPSLGPPLAASGQNILDTGGGVIVEVLNDTAEFIGGIFKILSSGFDSGSSFNVSSSPINVSVDVGTQSSGSITQSFVSPFAQSITSSTNLFNNISGQSQGSINLSSDQTTNSITGLVTGSSTAITNSLTKSPTQISNYSSGSFKSGADEGSASIKSSAEGGSDNISSSFNSSTENSSTIINQIPNSFASSSGSSATAQDDVSSLTNTSSGWAGKLWDFFKGSWTSFNSFGSSTTSLGSSNPTREDKKTDEVDINNPFECVNCNNNRDYE